MKHHAGQEFVVDGGVSKKMLYPEEQEEAAPAGTVAEGEAAEAVGEASGDERPSIVWPDTT